MPGGDRALETGWSARRLADRVRQEGFDVIDVQNPQSKAWGTLAAAATGAALVSTLNSWYGFEHGKSPKGLLYTWLELLTNRKLDGYIVVSKSVRDALQKAVKNVPAIDLRCAPTLELARIAR